MIPVCLIYVALIPPLIGNDVPMASAVESFVAESLRDRGHDIFLSQVIGERDSLAVRSLGANQWHARELASRVLAEQASQPGTMRALIWGTMCTDAEIRMRAETLLDELYRCPLCRGVGACTNCRGLGWFDAQRHQSCDQCTWRRDGVWVCRLCLGTGEPQR